MQRLKWLTITLAAIFCLPLTLQYLPERQNEQPTDQLVYASQPTSVPKDVLVVFTHSHEAYHPIVKAQKGTKANYDNEVNIEALKTPITAAFAQHQLNVHTIETDVMKTMQLSNSKFHQAYAVARPFVQQAVEAQSYDLILDIHRDSVKKQVTTLKTANGNFAKIAIVIGLEHPSYSWNLAYAEQLDSALNAVVPGISRGILKKEGKGVDGVYNQDLAQEMILVEIGGIENTEEEVLQTINVLAQAVRNVLSESVMQAEAL